MTCASLRIAAALSRKFILPTNSSDSLDCKEVNSVDQKPERRAGEITVDVKLAGLDEQLAKAHELVETIEKARSLADDLAKGINSIELEL